MLIHEIVNYCNDKYCSSDTEHICENCHHPTECSGNCKECLRQVHYPKKYPDGKHDYDCQNMINFYVCDYINKYASEMLYLLRKSEKLQELNEYHILSIGCGAAPDLMAFEQYVLEKNESKKICYCGFDRNELWNDIHQEIKDYNNALISAKFKYMDVFKYFESRSVRNVNVIVLQYVISHFYNTNQIRYIDDFFTNIVEKVVSKKNPDEPLIILINDTNSNKRGRDCFMNLWGELKKKGYSGNRKRFYFDYRIQNPNQRYGKMHIDNSVLFNLNEFDLKIYEPWKECSSAQLLIEIE